MIISYRPDDGPPVEFEFIPAKLGSAESELAENNGGPAWDTFEEWGAKFLRGHQRARRVALWLCMRRTNPKLKLEELSFRAEQVSVDYSPAERDAILQVMLTDPNLDDEMRANLEASVGSALVSDAEAALDAAGVERTPDLKDQPATSETPDSPSPVTA